jgi:hypothetical protein
VTKCSNCGAENPPDEPGRERQPCASCGSLERVHELTGTVAGRATVSGSVSVERGVNEARMTAFTLIFATAVGVGLSVGLATCLLFGVAAGVAAAVATAALLAVVYRSARVRHAVMELMHRITGQ